MLNLRNSANYVVGPRSPRSSFSDRSDRSDHMETINRCDRWTIFVSDRSDDSECSDHMETRLMKWMGLLSCRKRKPFKIPWHPNIRRLCKGNQPIPVTQNFQLCILFCRLASSSTCEKPFLVFKWKCDVLNVLDIAPFFNNKLYQKPGEIPLTCQEANIHYNRTADSWYR